MRQDPQQAPDQRLIMNLASILLSLVIVGWAWHPFAGNASRPALYGQANDLANTSWRLVSIGEPGKESEEVGQGKITIKFGADGRAGGSGGCNSYGAQYQVEGDGLSLSKIFSTKRACVDDQANHQEQQFLSALESARKFTISGDQLTISYGDCKGVLKFQRDSSQ